MKPEEYNFVSRKSTFLDIGSGFGKPNFHAAMQVYPKESIGVEVVAARVGYSVDQKYKFEEHYIRLKSRRQIPKTLMHTQESAEDVAEQIR